MVKSIKWSLLAISLIFIFCPKAKAQGTYTAASCSSASVNAVINGPTHTAVNGDVIIIPACTQTNWGDNATAALGNITITACIDLEGSGQGVTTIGDNVLKSGTDNSGLITFNVSCPSNIVKVGNLTIVGVATDPNVYSKGHIFFEGTAQGFRIYDITVSNPTTQLLATETVSPGVLDHITNLDCGVNGSVETGGMNLKSDQWAGENWGDGSWAAPDSALTSSAIYWENSTFTCVNQAALSEMGDAVAGARMVFRFNNFFGANTTSHGADTSQRERGVRWMESYLNDYSMYPIQSPAWLIWYRSGSGVVWGNVVTATAGYLNQIASVANCRDSASSESCGTSYSVWGTCNGTTVYDENLPSPGTGYRCIDQPGSGQGVDYGGATTPPSEWAGNDNLPIYIFLNNGNGSEFDITGNTDPGASYTNVAQNRDYYLYTSSFNGTSGVGSGTLANRPSTCTAGVAYWATDQGNWNSSNGTSGFGVPYAGQGELFKCASTNTWQLYYTPEPFPHPLTLPLSASNLTATAY